MGTTTDNAVQMECRPGKDGFAVALQIVSRLDQIRLVRAALCGIFLHVGVVQKEADFLALAAAEILTNAIEHGLKGDDSRDLQICVTILGNQVEIAVADDAPPPPEEDRLRLIGDTTAMEDASDQWSMRGHGLQIVHSIVDSVSVTRERGRNCVLLKKVVELQSSQKPQLS